MATLRLRLVPRRKLPRGPDDGVRGVDGELRPEIEAQIRKRGLSDRVTITGWVDSETVIETLGTCRALVVPSFAEVYAKEGWMHAKLALLLALAGATGVLTGKLRRWAEGQDVKAKTFVRLAVAISTLAVLIVTLAVFRPF